MIFHLSSDANPFTIFDARQKYVCCEQTSSLSNLPHFYMALRFPREKPFSKSNEKDAFWRKYLHHFGIVIFHSSYSVSDPFGKAN
jgi:hypothetical protein